MDYWRFPSWDQAKSEAIRPTLASMHDAQNLDGSLAPSIRDHEGRTSDHQFPFPWNPPGAAAVGKSRE